MASNTPPLTEERFHSALHQAIDKPVADFRLRRVGPKRARTKVPTDAHKAGWSEAAVKPGARTIDIRVYLHFKKNKLSENEYQKLVKLAKEGIAKYWSRQINVAGTVFNVHVNAFHRTNDAIPVDLYIERDKDKYARSMNPALLGIDASFVYNKGRLGNVQKSDDDFRLVAAHEFGHSVLMYADGLSISWGHKGTTNALTQSVKSSTPGYPERGSIDLMKYYDPEKSAVLFSRRIRDTVAMEIDIKRLIWGAKIKWLD